MKLRDALRPVIARLWLIVIFVAIATALTYYHYSSQPKEYSASTRLYIGSNSPTSLVNSLASDRENADLAGLVNSTAVMKLAAQELQAQGHQAAIAGSVSASPDNGADFVTINAVSGSASYAADLANAVANAFVQNETNTLRREAAQNVAEIERQLAALPNTLANESQRQELVSNLQQMKSIEAAPSAGVSHIDPAFPPGAPFAPNPTKDAIFAFAITLLLTIVGAYVLDRFDRRIRKLDDIEQIYGYPLLASIDRAATPAPQAGGASALPDELRESFRKLRSSLQLAAINEPPKTIVVTSAVPREGKSTITRNLALAYREAGLSVCVIDADLRRPSLAEMFGVASVPGLTDVVTGDEPLWGALKSAAVRVPGLRTISRLHGESPASGSNGPKWHSSRFSGADNAGLEKGPETDSILVLPSGPEPANPPVVLGSDQVRSLLSELAEGFDIVLLDTAPLLAVSDAIPLLSAVDGVLAVTRLGMTTSDAAEALVAQIRRIPGANLLGVVANDVHGRESKAGYYGYGYGYAHQRTTV